MYRRSDVAGIMIIIVRNELDLPISNPVKDSFSWVNALQIILQKKYNELFF